MTVKIITQAKETLKICSKDSINNHHWECMGVISFDYLLYKCSQCQKSKLVKIKYLQGDHVEE